ncbi:MAG: ATP-binding protein [Dongiaceae bacterium]
MTAASGGHRAMSLRRTLRVSLIALMTALGLVTAVASYILAGDEANDFFDNQLRQIALYVWSVPAGYRADTIGASPHDPEDDFLIQVWNRDGTAIMSSDPSIDLPRGTATGLSDATTSGIDWRVYTAITADRTVQVSQQTQVREELAADASLRATVPIVLLIPLSWLMLNWTIGRIIDRLDQVAADVAAREARGLDPISAESAPIEILPLISAVNDLVQRLQAALAQQRRFVADAAHELRTPLAAISLQVGNLMAAIGGDAKYAARIADLEAGSARASAVVGQLLRLARFESNIATPREQHVQLLPLAIESLERFAPMAEHRSIDLGLDQDAAPIVEGDSEEIRVLIDNLIDNAIRYTPQGGTIDLIIRVANGCPVLQVRDTGPGIPAASLPRVFERFYRASSAEIEGSGLGLAIAKAAADRNRVALTLENRADRSGLCATLTFRLAARLSAPQDI